MESAIMPGNLLMSGGINYGNNSGMAVTSMGNNKLTWETADQYDFGFDPAFERQTEYDSRYLSEEYEQPALFNALAWNKWFHPVSPATSVPCGTTVWNSSINGHLNIGKVN